MSARVLALLRLAAIENIRRTFNDSKGFTDPEILKFRSILQGG